MFKNGIFWAAIVLGTFLFSAAIMTEEPASSKISTIESDAKGFLQPTDIYIGKKPKMRETEWSRVIADSMNLPEDATEYTLPNGTRVDIFDRENMIAWEVEWCDKWQDASSQAKFYAHATGATPGIILLLRGNYEEDWLECLSVVVDERTNKPNFKFYYLKTE